MKRETLKLKPYIPAVLMLFFCGLITAQTPSDAIMMKQKQFCVGEVFEFSRFDHYWEGTNLRTNATIETVKRYSFNTMVAYGILDRLNILVGLPYVKTKSTVPNGGKFAGAEGFQDLSIALKGVIYQNEGAGGNLSVLGTIGFSTPVSNYLSDYRPYSIGFGANQFTYRAIAEYTLNSGFYARGAVAYLWRGTTEAERDYYYNDGSYYSATMDVPSAWDLRGTLGYWIIEDAFRVELNYFGLRSTSGDDVRAYNAPQPTNKVNYDRIGAFAQYHFKKPYGLGVLAYAMQTVNGRNTGKTTHVGAGITYFFGI